MRLGLLGGTFDPVHYGHLLLVEACREACRLDRIWLMPASIPPHKQELELTPAAHRIEMLRLAAGGNDALVVSCLEIDRGGVSYTVDTLKAVHTELPEAELLFLMGSDSLADLPHWKDLPRICDLALPVVVRRAGESEPNFECLASSVSPERLEVIRQHQVQMPLIELASSELRRRVSQGLSIRYQTPPAVERYIQTHGLYRN